MANGTVKWFNTTKGYGFIAPQSGGKDVFVHISAVERAGLTGLADDQKVTFDVEAGRDGRAHSRAPSPSSSRALATKPRRRRPASSSTRACSVTRPCSQTNVEVISEATEGRVHGAGA